MPNSEQPTQPHFPAQPSDPGKGKVQQPAPAGVPTQPDEVKPSYPGIYPDTPAGIQPNTTDAP